MLAPIGARAQMNDSEMQQRTEMILGYAYRYPWFNGTVLRFDTDGREINGSKPLESIPLCDARELDALHAENARLLNELEVVRRVAEALRLENAKLWDDARELAALLRRTR